MICSNCNTTINNNESVCPNCGTSVEPVKMRVPTRVNSTSDEGSNQQDGKYYSQAEVSFTSGSDTEINIAAEQILVDFLSGGDSKNEKNVKDNLDIHSFWNKKVKYITYEAFYQNREIRLNVAPSDYIADLPNEAIDPQKYDKWQAKLDSYKEVFIPERNKYTLGESLLKCTDCNNTGGFACTACRNGYNICPVCEGSKYYSCDDCDGKGQRACRICGGIGSYTLYTSDSQGNKFPTVYTCPTTETCSRCDGYGRLLCKKCVGHGRITCNVCDGKAIINCNKCDGKAWLKQSIEIEQTFNIYSDMTVSLGFFINKELYGDQYFQSIEPNSRDICINSFTDSNPISHFANYDLSQLNHKLEDFLSSNLRCNVYRVKEMMRIIAEIEFSVGKYNYHSLIDLSTGQLLFDTDPKQIIKALKELRISENSDVTEPKSQETKAISEQESGSLIENIKLAFAEIDKGILIASAGTVAILHIILALLGKHYLGLAIGTPIFTVIPVALIILLWNKVKLPEKIIPNNKIVLYLEVVGLSLLYVLLTFLIFHF